MSAYECSYDDLREASSYLAHTYFQVGVASDDGQACGVRCGTCQG
jgi:hypothetical protein